jgi:hypothetical protein
MSITAKITNISVTKIPTVCNILYAILKVVGMVLMTKETIFMKGTNSNVTLNQHQNFRN